MRILIANWKNYIINYKEAIKLFNLYKFLSTKKKALIIVAPNLFLLPLLRSVYKGRLISFAAQKLDACESSASTGFVCAESAKSAGADFVLLGHSEQRKKGLTDFEIKEAFYDALQNDIVPVLIVGEENQKDPDKFKKIKKQIKIVLDSYPKNKAPNFILAYEPVWAVGSDKLPTQNYLETIFIFLKKELTKIFGEKRANKIPFVYGGSVNEHNLGPILETGLVDGVLLGRASVDIESLSKIYAELGK